ncbi:MAG TPA: gliding motility-associated C-terminal domain-containing protein, partial [Flavisolibacter sp.]|nr:gliding motility-associated C-terminal domain-containing protein [Flavisolibacter sp.]
FNNTVDFDPGPSTFNITSSAHIQSFIVKLDHNGDFLWAKQFGNSPAVYSGAHIADVICDPQGNIYTVGNFTGACDFDPGTSNYALQSKSMSDGYIAKLDPNGQFVWAKQIGNTTNDYYKFAQSRGIDLDSENNVYTTGNFTGTFDFDPGINTYIISSNSSSYDWYILKLNKQGDFEWAGAVGSSEMDIGADIAVDNAGDVYAIGSVGHIADMNPGLGVYTTTSIGMYGAGALIHLNSNGSFLSAGLFDGTGSTITRRMVVDNSRNIYITGAISGTIDFDPGSNTSLLNGGSTEAPFVLKLGKCKHVTTSTLNVSACSSYTLNNEIFESTGTYIRTIMNSTGCDSIITLNLTINKKYTERNIAICEGESFFVGGSNQNTSGIYKDTLSTLSNCDSIVTTHLTVHHKPLPNLGADLDLCAGMEYILTPGSFSKYQWQDMTFSSQLKVNAPGLYWVKVTNDANCSAADSVIVRTILPLPAGFLKEKDSICSYQKLEIVSLQSYNSYLWSNGSNKDKIIIDQPGQYWLKVIDANGCMATDSITVFQKECMYGVYIPTAFTPNKDGKNDYLRPSVFGNVKRFSFIIYNRWGEEVFKTSDREKGWDGTFKGRLQDSNVYVWICNYQLEGEAPKYEKGTTMLIR